jgi:hypothetical protein
MPGARTRTQLFAVAACSMLAALLLTLVPTFGVHATSGFTAQTRLGFPAGDDWEPALATDRKSSYHGVS